MNKLITYFLLFLSFLSIVGCSQQNSSVNTHEVINVVSPKHTTKSSGYMQNAMDSFLKNDWEPTIAKDKTIQKKYMIKRNTENESLKEIYEEDKNRDFTLQEYIDKATAYSKAKPNDYNSSNTKKLNEMPIIGN